MLLQLVAKGLLTDYASDFEDMDQFGMVRFVAGLAVDTVIEKTNVHKLIERIRDVLPGGDEWDQEAGLLDPNYQLMMLRFREEHMLAGVARRLKRGIDNKMNPGEVFSRVQDHVIGAARAHVERLVLEAFVDKVRTVEDGDLKVALNLLCDLHALTTIEADRAWFMEHGRLTSQRSKAISREINGLCRKLRPLAVDLVDAFGVPQEMLRSPELHRLTVARPRVGRGLRRLERRPALGDVLRLDRRAPAARRCAVAARHRQRPEAAVRRRRRDRPAAGGRADPRRPLRRRRRAARPPARPGRLVRRRRHLADHARPDDGAARARGVADQVEPRTADVGELPFAGRRLRPGRLVHRAALLPRPAPARSPRWCGSCARAACSPAARCSTTPARRYEPMRRVGRRAGLLGPGCTADRSTTWLAEEGMTDVDLRDQRRHRLLPRHKR